MQEYPNQTPGTASRPAIDLERISVLERRSYLITVYEEYLIKDKFGNGGRGLFDKVRAALFSLILQIEGMLIRKYGQEEVKLMKDLVKEGTDIDRIEELITKLNIYLDDIKLTKLDTKRLTDRTNAIKNYETMGQDDD